MSSERRALRNLMNFRDLGGVPAASGMVAEGRLFRTGQLSEIDEESAAHLHEVLKVAVYIDFRAEAETTRDGPPRPLLARGVIWHPHPFDISDAEFKRLRAPRPEDWQALYLRAIERLRPEIAGAVSLISEQREPVVFGCWAGKDRTGIVAGLVLSLLGVDDEHVARDYAASSAGLLPFRHRFAWIWEHEPEAREELALCHTGTEPRAMLGMLSEVRARYGSIQRALGLSDDIIERLRARFVVA